MEKSVPVTCWLSRMCTRLLSANTPIFSMMSLDGTKQTAAAFVSVPSSQSRPRRESASEGSV